MIHQRDFAVVVIVLVSCWLPDIKYTVDSTDQMMLVQGHQIDRLPGIHPQRLTHSGSLAKNVCEA